MFPKVLEFGIRAFNFTMWVTVPRMLALMLTGELIVDLPSSEKYYYKDVCPSTATFLLWR